jgi:hypothetical protein
MLFRLYRAASVAVTGCRSCSAARATGIETRMLVPCGPGASGSSWSKNWLHIGSPQAGPKVAVILSVVESRRRLQVPVRDYFSTILPGLADLPMGAFQTLLPLCGSPGISVK